MMNENFESWSNFQYLMEKRAVSVWRYKRNLLFGLLYWKENYAADNQK